MALSWAVATFCRRAWARSSEAGSMPAIATISRPSDSRSTLIIRSVPMLQDPMIATFVRAFIWLLIRSLLLRRTRPCACRKYHPPWWEAVRAVYGRSTGEVARAGALARLALTAAR
ncbi:hypothetical protein SBI_01444 [Streptomyces bingchenggensis BCW-1]|uniref:Uncharacterized protein n=1 Tax=Streptomyces bingchenggensis (strain BCW-1) TaxID=749414 RepID=D7CDQ0_STRBB|nr:hypothetical protein SBI_01444 [Streptomyces bingchenggensis BCW-1]